MTWVSITDRYPPKDGKLYLARSKNDRGVVWWDKDHRRWGWLAEGKEFSPAAIIAWTDFPGDQ